jgi:hypothetical protein
LHLVIANGATAEISQGITELIKEAFSIRNRLLSGSDDSIEAMSARLGMNKFRLPPPMAGCGIGECRRARATAELVEPSSALERLGA